MIRRLTAIILPALMLGIAACGEDEPQLPQTPAQQVGSNKDDADDKNESMDAKTISIKTGNGTLKMTLADNSSARALVEKLREGDLTVNMHDYSSFEKVGPLGFSLPVNDSHISTVPGDVILYQGRNFVIYYGYNSWSLTRLGKIEGATRQSLLSVLGSGDVTVVLSLE